MQSISINLFLMIQFKYEYIGKAVVVGFQGKGELILTQIL